MGGGAIRVGFFMKGEVLPKKRMAPAVVMAVIALVVLMSAPVLAAAVQETNNGVGYVAYTGDAYPTSIVDAGYDVEANTMWLNIEFGTTTAPTTGMSYTWTYDVEIFDETSTSIGSLIGQTATGAADATTASVTDLEVTLTGTLTTEFRIVVTVTDLTETA